MVALRLAELASIETTGSAAPNCHQVNGRASSTLSRSGAKRRGSPGRRALDVLVVDGEPGSTDRLVRLVRHEGHLAQSASDGFAALRTAAAQHPDVVLLDMEIPLIDAVQVAKHLRRDFPSKKCFIVAVAERADEARRRQCVDAGIDLLLAKPVDLEILEMLLMLECARVNRGRVGRSGERSAQI